MRSVQCSPASRVVHSLPSSVPAHSSPFASGDSVSVTTVQWLSAKDPPVTILSGSRVVRSGLASAHLFPRS